MPASPQRRAVQVKLVRRDDLGLRIFGLELGAKGLGVAGYHQRDARGIEYIAAMAGDVLDPARVTLVVAGDAKAFGAQLKAKYPQAEIIPADKLNLDSPTLR